MEKQKSKRVVKLEPSLKIMLSLVVACVWWMATKGHPPRRNWLEGLTHVETTREAIFETAIEKETTRFTRRISQTAQGYWSYIPFVNQPKWIDVEIVLTIKIGFDISKDENFLIGTTAEGRRFIEMYEPTVIDKHWQTQIIDKSDNIFNKWDILEYEKMENEMMEAIAAAESSNILEAFKEDPNKMGQLMHRLDQAIGSRQTLLSSPIQWLAYINSFIDYKIKQFKYQMLMPRATPDNWTSPSYSSSPIEQTPQTSGKKYVRPRSRTQKDLKQAGYTEREKRIRQQMQQKRRQ